MNLESKVYRIEDIVFEKEPLVSEAELRNYFNFVIGNDPIKMYFCGPKMECSFALHGEIYILEEHFKKYIILHEIAHAVKRPAKNPHGKAWQKRYCDLVEKFLDRDGARELRLAFQKL